MKRTTSWLGRMLQVGAMAAVLGSGASLAGEAGAASAEDPGGGPGPAGRILRGALAQLDLSQEQRDQIRAAIQAERPALQSMRARRRADVLALRGAAGAAEPDPKAVGAAFLQVRQDREAARAARESLIRKVESLLTPVQKARFEGYLRATTDAVRARAARRSSGRNGQS